MQLNTVLFDMDGLLIDSEPLWEKATNLVFGDMGLNLTHEQYVGSTGLRTREFVAYWFDFFGIGPDIGRKTETNIIETVSQLIVDEGALMKGVHFIFSFFKERGFKIGIASSSPQSLIDTVINMASLKEYVQATASAEHLTYGKPHPAVYLLAAELLNANPLQCVCFEDSFNGLIAAKAARMKCVVVPHSTQQREDRWAAADLKLASLINFGELHLGLLSR